MSTVTPPHPGHRTPGRKGETSLHDGGGGGGGDDDDDGGGCDEPEI